MADSPTPTVEDSHSALISAIVLVVIVLVLVEVAGTSHEAAKWVLIVMGIVVLTRLMAQNGKYADVIAKYPWIP